MLCRFDSGPGQLLCEWSQSRRDSREALSLAAWLGLCVLLAHRSGHYLKDAIVIKLKPTVADIRKLREEWLCVRCDRLGRAARLALPDWKICKRCLDEIREK